MFIIKKHQQTPAILVIQMKIMNIAFLAGCKFITSNGS